MAYCCPTCARIMVHPMEEYSTGVNRNHCRSEYEKDPKCVPSVRRALKQLRIDIKNGGIEYCTKMALKAANIEIRNNSEWRNKNGKWRPL